MKFILVAMSGWQHCEIGFYTIMSDYCVNLFFGTTKAMGANSVRDFEVGKNVLWWLELDYCNIAVFV